MRITTSEFRKYAAVIFSATFFGIAPFLVYFYHVAVDRNFDIRWIDYFMLALSFAFMIYMFVFVHLRLAVIKVFDDRIEIRQYLIRKKSIDFKNISVIKESRFWTRMQLRDFEELKIYNSSGKLWFIISEQVYFNYNEIVQIVIEKINDNHH